MQPEAPRAPKPASCWPWPQHTDRQVPSVEPGCAVAPAPAMAGFASRTCLRRVARHRLEETTVLRVETLARERQGIRRLDADRLPAAGEPRLVRDRDCAGRK